MPDPVAPLPGTSPGPDVVSVAVLVELVRSATAGGHVKCWERFAEAAARFPGPGIDLTVYFLGEPEGIERLSPSVRLITLRPVLSTASLMPVTGGADVSDLSPYHPRLARLLPRHDVWHLTHSFAFASTAVRSARRATRAGAPRPVRMVASVHTDVPALADAYARHMAERLPAPVERVGGVLARGAACPVGALLRRRQDRLLRACDRVLVPTPAERAELAGVLGEDRVALLRRGVDHTRFHPDASARARLAREYGVPADRPLVLFAGRLDPSKRAAVVTEAVDLLRRRGLRAHLLMAGSGSDADAARIGRLLGPDVTLLGPLAQERLALVYAGCDIFAFPSLTETIGNVVAEAMASGLAVVLPEGARTTQWLSDPGRDGLVVTRDDARGWAEALSSLAGHPHLLRSVRQRAAATARDDHPSWDRVLAEDLLPAWRRPAHRPGTRAA
ncbi:glycosyltransferase [Streptomyces sp. GC420]|uniref:glycosyltransferase n=1 Tax=Streptomyces sp. GC420 TaxID=2697568 RepID=UPI0014153154|nr:glycosyltransferase [Streptomyces sp. GC420]NBM17292.1 glycosyltransferase [Streptomyces sp. GC420]